MLYIYIACNYLGIRKSEFVAKTTFFENFDLT